MAKPTSKTVATAKGKKFLSRKFYGYLAAGFLFAFLYFIALSSNLVIRSPKFFVVVKNPTTPELLAQEWVDKGILKFKFPFVWVADVMQFDVVKPGLYIVERGWGNVRLIANLQNKKPLAHKSISVKSYRNRSNIIKHLCKETGLDFKAFYDALNDVAFLKSLGLNKESVFVIFMPMVYDIPSNTNPSQVLELLKSHFDHYWNSDRTARAASARLNPIEATILSSIVYAETKAPFEMPIIAGVYINRLHKGMRLESDPTLVFAKGDFSMKRIYHKHTQSSSNYNTYRKKGLPPGPIGPLNFTAIEAIVNYTEHDYIFFCANDDLSGTHIYAETYHEHKLNARKYRAALNKLKIK